MGAALENLDRWIYLMHQAHEARYYIARAEELGHPHLWTAYGPFLEFLAHFRSALNSYAKCFVSTGPGRMKLESATVYSGDSKRLGNHDTVLDLRHKYVAHGDSNELESVRIIQEQGADELVLRLQYGLLFPFDRLYELRDLIHFVENYVVERLQNHVGSVAKEIGKPVRIREGP